jgi:WD40 repeat protein
VVSSSHDKTVKVWDAEAGRLVHTLAGNPRPVTLLSVYKEHVRGRDRIATGRMDAIIRVFDAEAGTLTQTLRGPSGLNVSTVAYETGEGPWRLLSGTSDGAIRTWDPEANQLLHTLHEQRRPIDHLHVFESEGGDRYRLVSGDRDGEVRVWALGDSVPARLGAMRAGNKTGV